MTIKESQDSMYELAYQKGYRAGLEWVVHYLSKVLEGLQGPNDETIRIPLVAIEKRIRDRLRGEE